MISKYQNVILKVNKRQKAPYFAKEKSGDKSIESTPNNIKKWKWQFHMKKKTVKIVQTSGRSPKPEKSEKFRCTNEPKGMKTAQTQNENNKRY